MESKTDKSSTDKEISKLRAEIHRHDHLYYAQNQPEISDREYDKLLQRLKELETQRPDLITSDSPTQRVGERPLEAFRRVRHSIAMLSIDNTYNIEEVKEFHNRVLRGLGAVKLDYIIDPKIDGVSASLRYENGKLALGSTRGDGEYGDDITQNIKTIKTIPLVLGGKDWPKVLEVRGEVYWPRKSFVEFNRQREKAGEAVLANPRNATAGALKLLDSRMVAQRKLSFICHSFGLVDPMPANSHYELSQMVATWGIPISKYLQKVGSIEEVIKIIEEWAQKRSELEYQTDGMVVKIDRFDYRDKLGTTARSPRWVIAYKYEAEQAPTVIRQVRWQVGKLGTLTPVADLDPVWVAGTTVSRASLHNFDIIQELGVRVGDSVIIEKAGEIIPQVVAVVKERPRGKEAIEPPKKCPVCEGPVKKDEGGVALRCINPSCPAQFKEQLEFYGKRDLMNIENLGPAIVEQLVDKGLVREYADLYKLKKEELTGLERMGPKSADNLVKGIEESKTRDLPRVIAALNIQHVGLRTAEELADHFKTMDQLMNTSVEELQNVPEIGPVVARSVYDYFHSPINRKIVEQLEKAGVNMKLQKAAPAGPQKLADKTLVVTGTLSQFSRREIEDLIKKHGGKVGSSVSSNTDFLIVGEDAGSKLEKAKELGVKTITEDEFLEMTK
ncbi:MAG: NAD-dependent DNA ligase LigA [Phycisphaerae bacterium]